ncbi:MAG TPA: ATP-binding protein [Syntrophorhabdaceae bacterium]|nr:ATP-binding protein [Syntrophorhabdaceae bacterium]
MVDTLQYTPQITLEFPIGEQNFFMAGESASKVKKTLQQIGLKQDIIKKIAIIIYEAAMNVAIHAHHGLLTVQIDAEGVSIQTSDQGAGIPDIDLAMQEGYSTAPYEVREMGFGAGMGLPNIKQCSDELTIDSRVGQGTTLKAKVYFSPKDPESSG